jgi:hypothetical protein
VAAFIADIREESSEAWASKSSDSSWEFRYNGSLGDAGGPLKGALKGRAGDGEKYGKIWEKHGNN